MAKEIISLHVGQAGVHMGYALWELMTAEHYIKVDGTAAQDADKEELLLSSPCFQHTAKGKFVPRTVIIDLDPMPIEEIKSGIYRNLFHANSLVSGMEDAANNFARGFFTIGNTISEKIGHEIRRNFECCDNAIGLQIFRSLGGGTGSGLTAAIFDHLSDYAKTVRVEYPIYPSPTLSSCPVEPYNSILGEHFCMDDVDISFLIDNESLYEIYYKTLAVKQPTSHDINRLIAQVSSSFTSASRYPCSITNDITTMQTNLVPFPRIHFPLISMAPLTSHEKASHETSTTQEITGDAFKKHNQLMKVDLSQGKYMSCSLVFRGDICQSDVFTALNKMKGSKNIRWVEWVPTAFKVGMMDRPIVTVKGSRLPAVNRSVTMLTNNSAIGTAIEKIVRRFKILYSKRAFVHWFVGEGLEESEFGESILNISGLIKDYEECARSTSSLDETAGDEGNTTEMTEN